MMGSKERSCFFVHGVLSPGACQLQAPADLLVLAAGDAPAQADGRRSTFGLVAEGFRVRLPEWVMTKVCVAILRDLVMVLQ